MPTQDNLIVLDGDHATVRAKINSALSAQAAKQNGGTEPASPRPFQEWADTSTNVLRRRNAANTLWLPYDTLSETMMVSRSSNTALNASDRGRFISATAAFTQTFAAAATLGDGWSVTYRNDSTGVVVLDPNGAELIEGLSTIELGPGQGLTIFCNGSAFSVSDPAAARRTQLNILDFLTSAERTDVLAKTYTIDVGPKWQIALARAKLINADLRMHNEGHLINTALTASAWTGIDVLGDGMGISKIKSTNGVDIFTLDGCQRGGIEGISFIGTGKSGGKAIKVQGVNCGLIHVRSCEFVQFPGPAVHFAGTFVNPSSECVHQDNVYLSNGVTLGTAQFLAENWHDHTNVNNTYGNLTVSAPFPPIGDELLNCQEGYMENNRHWANLVGGKYTNVSGIRVSANRWETNQREGSIWINSSFNNFDANRHHTNSEESDGAYDGMVMQSCAQWTFGANSWREWSGGVTRMRYCLNIDAACSNINPDGSKFYGYSIAPVLINAAAFECGADNCYPSGFGITRQYTRSFNTDTIAPNGSSFAGAGGGSALEPPSFSVFGVATLVRGGRAGTDVAPGSGNSRTVYMRKNGVDTAYTATIVDGNNTAAFTGTAPTFAINDRVSYRAVNSPSAAAGAVFGDVIFAE